MTMVLRTLFAVTLFALVGLAVTADRTSAAHHLPLAIEMPPTPSPTPSPSVRAIYAIPSDRAYDARYERAIREALVSVQRWYAEQLDGITFAIGEPLPQICHIEETAKTFAGEGGWGAVIEGVQHCAPVAHYSEWHTWVIFVDVPVPCEDGRDTAESHELYGGTSGVVMLNGGGIRGLIDPSAFQKCDWWQFLPNVDAAWVEGGLAHELGHAFGLPHPPECVDSPETCGDETVMWMGMYEYPDTSLRDEDAALLRQLLSSHSP